jgi:8-oxo-dGDP phosphatase
VAGFERVEEQELYAGHLLSMVRVLVRDPDGDLHDREVLHHPGAVGVLPLHDDATVTLVTQYRAALDGDVVEIPAGLRDVEDEPQAHTAERELAEEAGLAAERVEHLVSFHNSPGCSDELVDVYLATGLRAVADDRQGIEEHHMSVTRIPLVDAVAMVRDGRITDAKTVIALLLAATRPG